MRGAECTRISQQAGMPTSPARSLSTPSRSSNRPSYACCLFRHYGHLAATGFVGSALVADLRAHHAQVAAKTGHEGQFDERHGWQTGRTHSSKGRHAIASLVSGISTKNLVISSGVEKSLYREIAYFRYHRLPETTRHSEAAASASPCGAHRISAKRFHPPPGMIATSALCK